MSILHGIFPEKKESDWGSETQAKQAKVDWTHFLAPDALGLLRTVLESAYNHRQAYFKSEDIKNAQLWSAILELKREINILNERLDRLTPREKQTLRLEREGPDLAMQKIEDAVKSRVEDTKEATDALIDSLMKF
jgi:predicted RNase H-like nuclease (RuvC/YqgF family)